MKGARIWYGVRSDGSDPWQRRILEPCSSSVSSGLCSLLPLHFVTIAHMLWDFGSSFWPAVTAAAVHDCKDVAASLMPSTAAAAIQLLTSFTPLVGRYLLGLLTMDIPQIFWLWVHRRQDVPRPRPQACLSRRFHTSTYLGRRTTLWALYDRWVRTMKQITTL